MVREHYFSVATAKNVFEHPSHGIVFVRDAISLSDALNYKLTPVILYVVSAAGTSIHWLAFAPAGNPRSFCNVLQEAWEKAEGLRGAPDVLKINRHIANASPHLPAILEGVGIRVEVVDGDNKRLPAALRTAQGRVTGLSYAVERGKSEVEKMTSISMLNERAMSEHNNFNIRHCTDPHHSLAVANNHFLSLPARPFSCQLPDDNWEPGKWLSGWESNLPPSSSRFFNESNSGDTWLFEGAADADDSMVDMEYQPEAHVASLTKAMLGCWPNKISEVAKAIGITVRELNWYTSGRAELDTSKKAHLLTMLGIEINESYGNYESGGGCVLMASTPRATRAAYDEISHGGDLAYSFEIVPQKGNADPSYRYVLFCSCGGLTTILMVPRGGEASSMLDAENLINYEGLKEVENALYLDVVSTCARACAGFHENRREALRFASRNEQFFANQMI